MPTFRRPPLGEVVLGLQFEQLAAFDVRHIGPLVECFGAKYPQFETQQPLPPSIERFDGLMALRGFAINVVEPSLSPRIWLIDSKGEELVQIQRDRLMHNWRHTPLGSEYPHYPHLRQQFAEDWRLLDNFVHEHRLGSLLPTQCEVAYVNQIDADGGGVHDDPSKYFSFLAAPISRHGQSRFEAVTYSSSGVAQGSTDEGSLQGRMFVEVTSGINPSTKRITYQFALTVRGAPTDRDLNGVLQFFDFARTRIVRAFAELTTAEMHQAWERQQ